MLKINRKLSKRGFTLVELMVAVAILGIASVGIFQAFSVGFQSMADAKYRTVATNIAQEKLEEVKNSVKVAYPYYSNEIQEVNDKTYTVIVATNSQEDNLEQVYVTVSWHDRQGNEKNVQLETLIYDLQVVYEDVTPPDVGQIHLSADPIELTCCVEGEVSTITAELLTTEPVQRVPSGTPVRFNVDNGSVDPEFSVTDAIGKATTQLTLSGKNTASVTASSGIVSVPLQVSCKPKTSKIVLSASPSAITPESSSTITATVTDTCGDELPGESDQVVVTFNTNNGSFNGSTTTTDTTDIGIATVVLNDMGIATVATVVGTITVDEVDISDSTTVICTDYSISVSASPPSINPGGENDTSTITATLTTSGDDPINSQDISFATDKGSLLPTVATTDDSGVATVTLSSLLGGDIATITASYTFGAITISDTATVQCTEYIITLVANPDKVIPGSSSTITATLKNYEGVVAPSRRVDFYSTKGILSDISVYTNGSGEAVTTLIFTTDNVGETANVSATFGFASDNVNVTCINFVLKVSANPDSVSPGGSSVITALLTNYSEDPQSGQTITFNTSTGILSTTNPVTSGTTVTAMTNGSGEAVVHLTLNTVGTAIVTVDYDVVEDTVTVGCSDTYIILNSPPNIVRYSSNYYIRFDLYLHGGPLTVDKVKIDWNGSSPSRYRQIWIRVPAPSGTQTGGTEIYNSNHSNNHDIETLNEPPYTIPANSSFRITLRFNASIRNKHIIFTFNPDDPNADEDYKVEFDT